MFNFNQKLRERIKDLEREIEYLKKEHYLEKEKIDAKQMMKEEHDVVSLREKIAKNDAVITQLEARLKDAPYAQLTDILKALVVKLPTLNIQGITVTPKEK